MERLQPRAQRTLGLADLAEMFRTGRVPSPPPDGFLRGRLVATTVWAPLDAFFRRLASLWMPWQGKRFHANASTGVNRFSQSVRLPMRLFWPGYRPVAHEDRSLFAFEFRTGVGPGALDSGLDVLKIIYDLEANPRFIVRRTLDELVEIDEGLFLGKVLLRLGGRFRPVGYFALER